MTPRPMVSREPPVRRAALAVLWLLLGGILAMALTGPVSAQVLTLDMGDESASSTARLAQIVLLTTVLTLAPSILVMVTSFTRIIVVLSFLRMALGTQQTPPTQVLVSLALFMTVFIMMPTFETVYDQGLKPLIAGQIDEFQAFDRSAAPVRDFMLRQVRDQDLALFMDMGNIQEAASRAETPLRALVPAFMISELKRAFEIGFLIFVPFLIIDMVVASILMSMGMMMLPPVIIALPFKIIFFVLVDGWYLTVGSLVRSFGGG